MLEELSDILLLFLGWLLGLFSPLIVSYFEDKRNASTLKSALITELHELQYRLVLLVYRIETKYGKLDHTFFEWAQTIFSDYKGINSIETLINTLGPLLKLTPEEINTYSQVAKQNEVAKSALALKKHSLYFLEANVALISKFTPLLQAQLLEVKTRIGYMNETVDEANYYFRLSFQNEISSTNYEIANSNMIGSYKMYATQSREVVRIIKDVISENS